MTCPWCDDTGIVREGVTTEPVGQARPCKCFSGRWIAAKLVEDDVILTKAGRIGTRQCGLAWVSIAAWAARTAFFVGMALVVAKCPIAPLRVLAAATWAMMALLSGIALGKRLP